MLKRVIHIIFVLSCIGLTLSISVHTLTFFRINIEDFFKGIWFLHGFGIGLAGLTIILFKTNEYQAKKTADDKPKDSWETIRDGVPKLYINSLILLAIYALINFFNLMVNFGGSASFVNGEYVLMDHGSIIHTLTQFEYDYHRIFEIRSYSSAWIAIYGLVFALSNSSARFWKYY